jgi:hypothetical protein
MTLDFRALLADDAYAASFQSMGQYRTALLKALATPPPEPGKSIEELIAGCKPLDPAMAEMLTPDARWRLFGEDDSLPPPPEPPTVATDEELDKIWNFKDTRKGSLRTVYNLGVAHGQASSREVGKELMQLACQFFNFRGNSHGDSWFGTSIEAKQDPVTSLTAFANAVLEKWG